MSNFLPKIIGWVFDTSALIIGPKAPANLQIQDIEIKKGVRLRVYKPTFSKNNNLPTVVYYHGGGWIIGSIKAYDRILRYISYKSGYLIVAVEYRKAPKYKFPIALEDAVLGYNWVINNAVRIGCNKDKIALMGDSAGGNIAALVQARLGETYKTLPKLLVLIYPVVDVSTKALNDIKKDERWLISKYGYSILRFCLNHYLGSLKESKLIGLALPVNLKVNKMLIITAEIDSLTKSIRLYEKKLRKAVVSVIVKHYADTFHGFLNYAGVFKKAKKALDDIVSFLTREFS